MSFDLETSLAAWRRPYEVNPAFSAADIEELENSLRDRIEALMGASRSEEEAFRIAVRQVGSYGTAEAEYKKVYWGKVKRERRLTEELAWRWTLLGNYVTVAYRNLRKQTGYALINIVGLAVGLACFILISLFVGFELSYDRFHEHADRIYRIAKEEPGGTYFGINKWATTPGPLVRALMEEFPDVESAAQIEGVRMLLESEEARSFEDGIYATEHFFDVFSFPLLQGNPSTVLAQPNGIILTASLARKYFGETNPVGQTLAVTLEDDGDVRALDMQVVGLVEDAPPNSHISFDYIVSMSSQDYYVSFIDHWDNNNYRTYALLRPDHSLPAFTARLSALAGKHLGRLAYYREHPDEIGTYYPQVLTDIHLRSHLNGELGPNGDIRYVYLFSAIALLILLIASINYVNLAMARSVTRTVEVGVRKAMGAHRSQLIGQFMGESILPTLLALVIAVLLVVLLLPAFNALTAREMAPDVGDMGGLLATLLLVGLAVGILSGSYPAFVMSAFHPVGMMKGRLHGTAGKTTLRNGLVVVQLSITLVLIMGTLVVHRQLGYIQRADTGVERDHIVSIETKDPALHERYDALRQTLLNHPTVLSVTASQHNPTRISSQSDTREWEGAAEGQRISVYYTTVQHGFVEQMGIDLVEGRDFSPSMGADEREGMLINETLMRRLGWDTAVGKRFTFRRREARIIGVMKDFNFLSFRQEMAPLALYLDSGNRYTYSHLLVTVRPDDMQETLAFMEQTMADFSPAYPFHYQFLDDAYMNMYRTEVRLGNLMSYFTMLALLVAGLGLLGLTTLTARQRTKEIGVRKVLGATLSDIVVLLSKEFTRLVLTAFVLAAPIAYIVLSRWLEGFAYRISLGWGTFLLAGAGFFLITWLTVGYQSARAALADPVKSLRHE